MSKVSPSELQKAKEELNYLMGRFYTLGEYIKVNKCISATTAKYPQDDMPNESFWGFVQAYMLHRLIAIDLIAILGEGKNNLRFTTALAPLVKDISQVKNLFNVLSQIKRKFKIGDLKKYRDSYAAHIDHPQELCNIDLKDIEKYLDNLRMHANEISKKIHYLLTGKNHNGEYPEIREDFHPLIQDIKNLLREKSTV